MGNLPLLSPGSPSWQSHLPSLPATNTQPVGTHQREDAPPAIPSLGALLAAQPALLGTWCRERRAALCRSLQENVRLAENTKLYNMISPQIGAKSAKKHLVGWNSPNCVMEMLQLVQIKTFHSMLCPNCSLFYNFSLHNDNVMCSYFQELHK